jgi:hypothetical protein
MYMRKALGFYKSATEAFHEGLVPEVLNGTRDGETLRPGEEFFAGIRVLRQWGHQSMMMWLFATNQRFFVWQHKSIGSIDELLKSDCEAIEFKRLTGCRVGIQKLLRVLPFTPREEVEIKGFVDHIVRDSEPSKEEKWYLTDQRSQFNAGRLIGFITDSLSNAGVTSDFIHAQPNQREKAIGWISIISLGLGLFVGAPAWWFYDKHLGPSTQELQCTPSPFRCKLRGIAVNGFYGVLESGTFSPPYAISVRDGFVTSDSTEADSYGCLGLGCDHYSSSGNNKYSVFNERQIIRETPDGKTVVLTWYKNLD